MPKKKELTFEDSLEQAEKLVQALERGEMKLEDSIQAFENASTLLSFCQKSLSKAEKKIEVLLEDGQWKEVQDDE